MASEIKERDVFISYRNEAHSSDKASSATSKTFGAVFSENFAIETFVDFKDIHAGDNFIPKIDAAITRSKAVICLVSDQYFESKYCKYEIGEAIDQGKALVFATDPTFNPVNHPRLSSTSVVNIAGWTGNLAFEAVRASLPKLFEKIGRPSLRDLIQPLIVGGDDDILRWCRSNSDDPAARHHIDRVFRARLDERDMANQSMAAELEKRVDSIIEAARKAVKAETSFLKQMRTKFQKNESISVDDCLELIEQHHVDLSLVSDGSRHSASVERLTGERDEAIARAAKAELELKVALADKSAGAAHNEKLLSQLTDKQKEIDRISKKLAELANPHGDVVADILSHLDQRMAGPCKDNVRQAGNYLKSANASHADADRLQRMVEDAIRGGRAKVPPGKSRNGHVIHYVDADDTSRARYMGRVELPKLLGTSIHARRYWGYFDDFPKFKGPGVIHFHDGAGHVFSYFGELKNLAPEGGACGVFTSVGSGRRFTRWEGSWPQPLGFGRLVLADGTRFYGMVRMGDFGEILEDDHGVVQHSGPNAKGESYSHGFWQMGQKHPGR